MASSFWLCSLLNQPVDKQFTCHLAYLRHRISVIMSITFGVMITGGIQNIAGSVRWLDLGDVPALMTKSQS
jgi:hypothetical protein